MSDDQMQIIIAALKGMDTRFEVIQTTLQGLNQNVKDFRVELVSIDNKFEEEFHLERGFDGMKKDFKGFGNRINEMEHEFKKRLDVIDASISGLKLIVTDMVKAQVKR